MTDAFSFYYSVFMGSKISEGDFPRLFRRALDFIMYATQNRACEESCAVMKCACAIAEAMHDAEAEQTHDAVASETVGAWSVSYRSGADAEKSNNARMMAICHRYLDTEGLMYRGGGYL